MYVLHRTFGLIGQKVIYISIPLVARVKRRAASIHRTSERAHSRKPALIHPHTYKVPERRQAGLISELPRRLIPGNSEGYKARKGPGCREPRRKGKLGFVLEGGCLLPSLLYCDNGRKYQSCQGLPCLYSPGFRQ